MYRRGVLIAKKASYQVYYAEFVPTAKNCLVKQLNKQGAAQLVKTNKALVAQAEVWAKLTHPELVSVIDLMQDDYFFYIISEACTGMPAAELKSALTENQAANVLFCVLSALRTIHSAQLLHLAISSTTVLLLDQELKLAKVLSPVDAADKPTENSEDFEVFTAPESEKTEKSDVWSCGVLLVFLLTCELPYSIDQYREICSSSQVVRPQSSKLIMKKAKKLITGMLSASSALRPSIEECISDPWLLANRSIVHTRVVSQTVGSLRSANKMTPMKAAVLNFMVTRVMKGSQLAKYAEVFSAMDIDGNGSLTPEELQTGLERIMPPVQAAAEVEKITSAVQLDGDETISYHEYLFSSLDQATLFSLENLKVVFAHFDSDHSGSVSAEELKAQLFGSSEQSAALWNELSKHAALRDGNVSFDEFVEMLSDVQ
jgi:calcium-dependent protein kinase